jgi:hypothetical protein
MLSRLLSLGVFVLLGVAIGFTLWGSRVAQLSRSVERLMLDDETLRTRLAARQAAADDNETALLLTLSELSAEVGAQAGIIARQELKIHELASAELNRIEASRKHCEQVESRMQNELESCLFVRASLERQVQTLERLSKTPREGTAAIRTRRSSAQEVFDQVTGSR